MSVEVLIFTSFVFVRGDLFLIVFICIDDVILCSCKSSIVLCDLLYLTLPYLTLPYLTLPLAQQWYAIIHLTPSIHLFILTSSYSSSLTFPFYLTHHHHHHLTTTSPSSSFLIYLTHHHHHHQPLTLPLLPQGVDPATDLRGVGLLGLVQALYLLTHESLLPLARDVFRLSHDHHSQFPLMVLSINVTRISLQTLREGYLNKCVCVCVCVCVDTLISVCVCVCVLFVGKS